MQEGVILTSEERNALDNFFLTGEPPADREGKVAMKKIARYLQPRKSYPKLRKPVVGILASPEDLDALEGHEDFENLFWFELPHAETPADLAVYVCEFIMDNTEFQLESFQIVVPVRDSFLHLSHFLGVNAFSNLFATSLAFVDMQFCDIDTITAIEGDESDMEDEDEGDESDVDILDIDVDVDEDEDEDEDESEEEEEESDQEDVRDMLMRMRKKK